jgi:TFIIH basal transcription factor complex TTD-A subunit
MVSVKKGVLIKWYDQSVDNYYLSQFISSDPAMKQFLVHLDETRALGSSFVVKDLDDTHLFVDKEIVPILEQKIDELMEMLSPDLVEK